MTNRYSHKVLQTKCDTTLLNQTVKTKKHSTQQMTCSKLKLLCFLKNCLKEKQKVCYFTSMDPKKIDKTHSNSNKNALCTAHLISTKTSTACTSNIDMNALCTSNIKQYWKVAILYTCIT